MLRALARIPCVRSVWLGGSRSPISPKNPHAGSDWDLQVVTGTVVKKTDLPDPAELGVYCDLFPRRAPSKYAVQIWPVDVYGVLS
jgi:hypothetical protein